MDIATFLKSALKPLQNRKRDIPEIPHIDLLSKRVSIVTTKQLIECKIVDWNSLSEKKVQEYKRQFLEFQALANSIEKMFAVYSKNPMPDMWKQWFAKHQIDFNDKG